MARKESGIVDSGDTLTIPLAMKPHENGFQISVTGSGSLAISTQESGNAAFTTQTTISDESLIVDLYAVNQVRLVASVANVPYVLRTRDEMVSTPDSNWNDFDNSVNR